MNHNDEMPGTQPIDILTQSQPEQQTQSVSREIWGYLTPIQHKSYTDLFKLIELSSDKYSVGRSEQADMQVVAPDIAQTSKFVQVISKIHFIIYREVVSRQNDTVVFIEDCSGNGTFVNGKLVGRGNKVVLENQDIISLAKTRFEVYTFTSSKIYDPRGLPVELKPNYVALKHLGSGACGEVKMVFSKNTHKTFAIKAIAKQLTLNGCKNPLNDPRKIMNEVEILKALKNPFIIQMEEIVDTPRSLYIVLELMEGGELFDRISNAQGLPEKQSKFIFYQIASAVKYLHDHGITHRDLKPENILLASDEEYPLVKVTDFGLSKFVDAESLMKTFCGTPMYVAPEILLTGGRGAYTNQVDVWSLGVILYVTLSGCVPFTQGNKRLPLQQQIIKAQYTFPPQKFAYVTNLATSLIEGMLTRDPKRRKTIREVVVHPWLQDREMRLGVSRFVDNFNNENESPNITGSDSPELSGMNGHNSHAFDRPGPARVVGPLTKRLRID